MGILRRRRRPACCERCKNACAEGQYSVFRMDAVMDAWARDIAVQQTQNGITLEDVRIDHTRPHSGAAAPADFSLGGQLRKRLGERTVVAIGYGK